MTKETITYDINSPDLKGYEFIVINGVEYKLTPHPDYKYSYNATPVLTIENKEND